MSNWWLLLIVPTGVICGVPLIWTVSFALWSAWRMLLGFD